ncbi:Protein of uncharacterised function (DUF754) [Streptococcus dysgalactiae subsp. equisimilis]|nr:Protein of uncharacterised function (DUF754) [Streptococcus dysgalactiae subsp. equisimilis]
MRKSAPNFAPRYSQALGILAGLYRAEHLSPWMLGVLLVLLILLLQARGNLARVLRLY